jgi:hypothetical protein
MWNEVPLVSMTCRSDFQKALSLLSWRQFIIPTRNGAKFCFGFRRNTGVAVANS